MSFQFHRVFCATPGDVEEELSAFHEVVGQVNEELGQTTGSLFVPVCVPTHIQSTELLRPALDANIRDCEFYVQVFRDGWGPPQRNFEPQFQLAERLLQDKERPLKGIAGFIREEALPADRDAAALQAGLVELRQRTYIYSDVADFKRCLQKQLTEWLAF